MNKTLHKLAAHCAPPAPGVLRALVPGVLCGWGCAGLLALGHPWLAGAPALAAAAVAGQWWKPSFWAESWKGRGWLLPTPAVAFFCGSGRGMLRRWPALLSVVCNIASVVVAASTNEIRYLLPTFLLAVPSALFFALEGGVPDDQTKGVSEPCR